MQLALHDPEHGYYARRISTVGVGGDFTTAAETAPALAAAVARWLVAASGRTGIREVIELGPGTGSLCAAVRGMLGWWQCRRFRFHLVESSRPLRAVQRRRIGRATWHDDLPAALAACDGRALVFSNEFVDAFPARRFLLTPGGWRELGVAAEDGLLREVLMEPGPLPDSLLFDSALPPGQVIEVHEAFRDWLDGLAAGWRGGEMLTIDYGARDAARLYHRRPGGTLRGYLLQQRVEGDAVLANPGRQDLTADVHFADLVGWGEELGLVTTSLIPQSQFLAPFIDPGGPGSRHAADPAGAGSAFLVLNQVRASPGPAKAPLS